MILLNNIDFCSCCEHHLLPFTGSVDIAYYSGDETVIGISKLARVVEIFSRRLQLQERMTKQIADAIQYNTTASGVAVSIRAKHHCIAMRGVKKNNSVMHTSYFTGVFKTDKSKREEFFNSIS